MTDDEKVKYHDTRTLVEFERFFKATISKDTAFTHPDNLFNDYDDAFEIGDFQYIVELKERAEHYPTYMIDTYKVGRLLTYAERGVNVRLIVSEPLDNKIYVFDLNAVKWAEIDRQKRWVWESDLRTERGQQTTKTLKEFFFLPWSLARCYDWDEWSRETIAACKEMRERNQRRRQKINPTEK